MKVADFFCGAGGFSEGFRQAGFDVVFAVDKWLPAVNTHHENHPESKTIQGDVELISNLPDEEFHSLIPDTEIIIGSPPCVAFSNSNKSGKGDKELGIRLLESYLRIVARKKHKEGSILKYWILENVPNIEGYINPFYTSHDLGVDGEFVLQVKSESSGVYNSSCFAVAQNRKRYLCGHFPKPVSNMKKEEIIPLKIILNTLGVPNENTSKNIEDPNHKFSMISNDITDHHYIYELTEFEWKKAKRLKEDKGYMGKMSFPEDIEKPGRTVMATASVSSRESIIYQYQDKSYRLPTVRELASIMSFPIDYRFYGNSRGVKSRLVGNAVPPKMSFAFAKEIAKVENLEIPDSYKPLLFPNKVPFINLNHQVYELNKEKPKKEVAKFKYHIPYLIINSYRVELTNYNSIFDKKIFNWDVEIHKSQGKNAKVYTPSIENVNIEDEDIFNKINVFISKIESQLVSFNIFQKYYCLTNENRKGKLGPEELLEEVKMFIVTSFEDETLAKTTFLENKQQQQQSLPYPIAIGYMVLLQIIDKMRSIYDEQRNENKET